MRAQNEQQSAALGWKASPHTYAATWVPSRTNGKRKSLMRQNVPRKGPKRHCYFCQNYSCPGLSPGQTQDTGRGEIFQFRKDSRDLAETQEMEHHHLEANIGKAEASPSDLMFVEHLLRSKK